MSELPSLRAKRRLGNRNALGIGVPDGHGYAVARQTLVVAARGGVGQGDGFVGRIGVVPGGYGHRLFLFPVRGGEVQEGRVQRHGSVSGAFDGDPHVCGRLGGEDHGVAFSNSGLAVGRLREIQPCGRHGDASAVVVLHAHARAVLA